MKLLNFLLGGGIAIVLITIDQYNQGAVFFTGIGFTILTIISMLYSVNKSLKDK